MLNKVAVMFADLYHQRISVYEVRPDFYFSLFNPHEAEGKHAFFFLNLPIVPSCLASPGWSLSSKRLNTPLTLQPELKSMALFCLFVIVSVR